MSEMGTKMWAKGFHHNQLPRLCAVHNHIMSHEFLVEDLARVDLTRKGDTIPAAGVGGQ